MSDQKVGLFAPPGCLAHDAGAQHPERRERVETILAHLDASGLSGRVQRPTVVRASLDDARVVHSSGHLELLRRADEAGGARFDADTSMRPGSLDAALDALGACLGAVRAVAEGDLEGGAFVAVRPPGHHATATMPMGFCLVNNVAAAAGFALREGLAGRVAIVDWDAHHGNGTQDIFWADQRVLYVSLHQYPFYPGSGAVDEAGDGEAEGATLNIPLPAGSGGEVYRQAFSDLVVPALDRHEPDLLLVSAGYDAHRNDPLCSMRLLAGNFHELTTQLLGVGLAPIVVLEGGYDLDALAWSSAATLAAMLGADDPDGVPAQELGDLESAPHAFRWLAEAVRVRAAVAGS